MANKISQTANAPGGALTAPVELMLFSEPSFLLPGEDLRDYEPSAR
jgi:hypothetical protein